MLPLTDAPFYEAICWLNASRQFMLMMKKGAVESRPVDG